MKVIGWFLISLGFAAVVLILLLLYKGSGESYLDKEKKEIFARLVGVYQLDIEKSALDDYLPDTSKLKEFKLILKSDSTFSFTQKTNFLYNSTGVWTVDRDGANSWSTLHYNKYFSNQIQSCCEDNKELSIYLAPVGNSAQIQFISLKRIK